MGYDIFISYRRDNPALGITGGESLAMNLRGVLAGMWDYDIFLDSKEIRVASSWRDTIRQALDMSRAVVVILSPGCFTVEKTDDIFLSMEIGHAVANAPKVVPVFARGFDPKTLPDKVELKKLLEINGIEEDKLKGDILAISREVARAVGTSEKLRKSKLSEYRRMYREFLDSDDKIVRTERDALRDFMDRYLLEQVGEAVDEIEQEEDENHRLRLQRARGTSPLPIPTTQPIPTPIDTVSAPAMTTPVVSPPPVPEVRPAPPPPTPSSPAVLVNHPTPPTSPAGPTRFARKYINDQEPELARICWALLDGLPATIVYHHDRTADAIWLHHSDWEESSVAFRVRPRLHRLDVLINVVAEDEVGNGTSFLQRLIESGAPNVEKKYSGWPGDRRICCALHKDNSPDEIAAVKAYIAWFLLEAPGLSAQAEAAGGAASRSAEEHAPPTSGGPTRFARKYIEEAEPALSAICWRLLEGLPGSVEYHHDRTDDFVNFYNTATPDWYVIFRIRPRLHRLDVVFNSAEDEELKDGSIVFDRLRQSGAPGVEMSYNGWPGDGRICLLLGADTPVENLDPARDFIRWYLVEAPKLAAEDD